VILSHKDHWNLYKKNHTIIIYESDFVSYFKHIHGLCYHIIIFLIYTDSCSLQCSLSIAYSLGITSEMIGSQYKSMLHGVGEIWGPALLS
jgi:hypothetical protein